ncbi:MAG TPA: flagellar biosynthetic protein FliQ [Polyangiaceae bacterium]|nr:flagellar biosynthetic protein FliQ [Polyangiaceae bacterium]
MPPRELAAYAQEALLLSVAIALPVVAVAAIVGLVVAVLQAATQIQDVTIAHLPRFLAVALTLALLGPWMGRQIAAFAARVFAGV